MPLGALIDPNGHQPIALGEHEYTRLRELLDLDSKQGRGAPIPDAIGWLLHLSKDHPDMTNAGVVSWIANHFMQECNDEEGYYGDAAGVLVPRFPSNPVAILTERETQALNWTLRTIRTGSWFASWLVTQAMTVAEATTPAERCPTPLQVMASLTLDADEFDAHIASARAMMQLRPDLVAEQPAAEPPATQEPPAPEPPKASKPRSTPAKKARRKAA